MKSKEHTIDDLYTDSGPFDESEAVKALLPLVTIQKSTNHIYFKGTKLSAEQKIIAYGLAKKLLKSKSAIETEFITALEIHKKTGIKKGTIDPSFKSLKEKGLLVGKRKYEIPTHKIHSAISFLEGRRKAKV